MSELESQIQDIAVIDSHEHLMPIAARNELATDFSYLFSNYLRPEFVSAGATLAELQAFYSAETDEREKIALFERFWPSLKNTSFARAKVRIAREIFGVSELNRDGLRLLSERIQESRRADWYAHLLAEARIETVVVNYFKTHHRLGWTEVESGSARYRYTAGFDDFLWLASRGDIDGLEEGFRTRIQSLDDLLETLEKAIQMRIRPATPAVKTVAAYFRDLGVDGPVTHSKAEQVLKRILQVPARPFDATLFGQHLAWAKPLQDLLLARIFERAGELGLPVQVHAGYQAGNGNVLRHADPGRLNSTFLRHPETHFEILHVGFPYHHNAVALAKMLPNLTLNFSWIFGLAPEAALESLRLACDLIPASRVVAFGGDYRLVEGAVVHLQIAKEAIAAVLESKVRDAGWTVDEAVEYARAILYENPRRLYHVAPATTRAAV
jgi:predicted TIM-barrel fold metal-dependent hydrolase